MITPLYTMKKLYRIKVRAGRSATEASQQLEKIENQLKEMASMIESYRNDLDVSQDYEDMADHIDRAIGSLGLFNINTAYLSDAKADLNYYQGQKEVFNRILNDTQGMSEEEAREYESWKADYEESTRDQQLLRRVF